MRKLRKRTFSRGAVERFKAFAAANREIAFKVTAIGCGLAGFRADQIAPMFEDAPPNCMLPPEFVSALAART